MRSGTENGEHRWDMAQRTGHGGRVKIGARAGAREEKFLHDLGWRRKQERQDAGLAWHRDLSRKTRVGIAVLECSFGAETDPAAELNAWRANSWAHGRRDPWAQG
jgi:hypothetical protein